jgi:hypothetical protein
MTIKGNKRFYRVIAAWANGKEIFDFPKEDIPSLTSANLKAEQSCPSWDMFGGTLDIGARTYQLA